MNYKTVTYEAIEVCYREKHNGGGIPLAMDFVARIKQSIGKKNRLFEWCAGPAFVGFALLAHGLCDSLCLADINPEAIEDCKATIRQNHLEDKVTTYLSDCLDNIPTIEQWDLVVGNPPHFNTLQEYTHFGPAILYQDNQWLLHRKFYNQIRHHLKPDGEILLLEHAGFSRPETFQEMIKAGGLRLRGSLPTRLPSRLYYIHTSP